MLTRLYIAALIILLPLTADAQLSQKTLDSSVVLLSSPGKCTGTGFFISGNTILTAGHVIKTTNIEATVKGKVYQCKLVKKDSRLDYAMVKITGYTCKTPLQFAPPQKREYLYSYGYPSDGKLHIADGRCYIGYLYGCWMFSGDAKPGMSGGPVVNTSGQVVGITTNTGPFGHTIFRSTSEVQR